MPKRNRLTLWILLLLFSVPMLLAYYYFQRGVPMGSVNRGTLLRPPEEVKFTIRTHDDKLVPDNIYQGKWSIVYLHASRCDVACQQRMHQLQNVQIATGKHQNHVQTLLINFIPLASHEVKNLSTQAPKAKYLWAYRHDVVKKLPKGALRNFDPQQGGIYLVDPKGLYMMSYAYDVKGEDIFKDLTRLLQVN